MKIKDLTPIEALNLIEDTYNRGQLGRQLSTGFPTYWNPKLSCSCAVGCLIDFSEEEKQMEVRYLSSLGLDTDGYHSELYGGESIKSLCGIDAKDLEGLQSFHDNMQWTDFVALLNTLKIKYAGDNNETA